MTTKISDAASGAYAGFTKKTYPAPKIPHTPSEAINKMLQDKCGHSFDNPVKAAIAHYIALVFTFIVKVYELIHKDTRPSHSMWMAACGVISAVIVAKVMIAYNVLVSCAFLVHFALYYAAIGLALFGAGLGIAGAVFFDKNSSHAATGFAEKTKTRVRETTTRFQQETMNKME